MMEDIIELLDMTNETYVVVEDGKPSYVVLGYKKYKSLIERSSLTKMHIKKHEQKRSAPQIPVPVQKQTTPEVPKQEQRRPEITGNIHEDIIRRASTTLQKPHEEIRKELKEKLANKTVTKPIFEQQEVPQGEPIKEEKIPEGSIGNERLVLESQEISADHPANEEFSPAKAPKKA